jgi:hypothetical protein
MVLLAAHIEMEILAGVATSPRPKGGICFAKQCHKAL